MTATHPEALPPHLRILVLGNSTSLLVGPRRASREEGTYGEVLESRLRGRGINALLINEARPWELVHQVMPRAVTILAQQSPDVVVLNYGLGECEPNVFPTPLMRWMTKTRSAPSLNPVVRPVRNAVLAMLPRLMVWVMPRIGQRLGMHTWRLRPRRFTAELTRLILFTRAKTASLVLVVLPNTPGPLIQKLMPGFKERADRYRGIMRDLVTRLDDPEVRAIETASVVEQLGVRAALSDGLHYTARGHEAVAVLLEVAVTDWLVSRDIGAAARRGSDEVPG